MRKLVGGITIHISCRRLSPLSMFGYLTFNSPTLSRTVTQSPYPRCSFHIQFAISGCYGLSQRNSYHIVYYARNLRFGWSSNVTLTVMLRAGHFGQNIWKSRVRWLLKLWKRLTRSLPRKTWVFNLFTFWVEQVNEQVKLYLTVQRFQRPVLNEIDELGNDTNSRSHGSNQVVFFKITRNHSWKNLW